MEPEDFEVVWTGGENGMKEDIQIIYNAEVDGNKGSSTVIWIHGCNEMREGTKRGDEEEVDVVRRSSNHKLSFHIPEEK